MTTNIIIKLPTLLLLAKQQNPKGRDCVRDIVLACIRLYVNAYNIFVSTSLKLGPIGITSMYSASLLPPPPSCYCSLELTLILKYHFHNYRELASLLQQRSNRNIRDFLAPQLKCFALPSDVEHMKMCRKEMCGEFVCVWRVVAVEDNTLMTCPHLQ